MARSSALQSLEEGILPDHLVEDLLERLTPVQRRFLSGLGRGLSPVESARRAGWQGDQADRIAKAYLDAHPVVSRLAAHVLRLRELASLADDEPSPGSSNSIH